MALLPWQERLFEKAYKRYGEQFTLVDKEVFLRFFILGIQGFYRNAYKRNKQKAEKAARKLLAQGKTIRYVQGKLEVLDDEAPKEADEA